MENLSALVTNISSALSISRGESATLIAVIIGSLISVFAAAASWFAAMGALASVKEMKAARLDKQRPVLIHDDSADWVFHWNRSDNTSGYNLENAESDAPLLSTPVIKVRNAGSGSAVDLSLSLSSLQHCYNQTSDISHLKRVFSASGITVSRTKHGISFVDEDEELDRWYFNSTPSTLGTPIIAHGETGEIHISPNLIEAYLIKGISEDPDAATKNMAWVIPSTLGFYTTSGERRRYKVGLVLSYKHLSLVVGDPPTLKLGVPNWSRLSVHFSLYITENWQGPGFTRLTLNQLYRLKNQVLSRILDRANSADQSLARWTYYRGRRQFRIGDKVARVVDSDWNVEPDDQDIEPMPEGSWDLADKKLRKTRKPPKKQS